eukprot:EG_transcript_6997
MLLRCCLFGLLWLLSPATAAESSGPDRLGVRTTSGGCSDCHFTPEGSIMCGKMEYKTENLAKFGSKEFWMNVAISVGLVLGAATAAGLTMGLMSMDLMNLEILQKSGTPAEQHHAARIIPLVKQHHLLLVTLLLVNACCNEALPLFLDELMHPVTNIIVSVTALLLFGEIIPQAICTRYGLAIGSQAAPLVWALIWGAWVIAYPIAKLLDCCLGPETHVYYRRAQLKELVDIHGHVAGSQFEEALTADECMIIQGALDLKNKTVADCLTPMEDVTMLDYDGVLNKETMQRLLDGGHSRIPVFVRSHRDGNEGNQPYQILGMILVKSLILFNSERATPIRECNLRKVPFVPTTKPLYDMLNLFQEGRSHMAVAVDPRDHMTYKGVITLEDVIEQLIQEPISDETDSAWNRMCSKVYTDNPDSSCKDHEKRPGRIQALINRKTGGATYMSPLGAPGGSSNAGKCVSIAAPQQACVEMDADPSETTPLVRRSQSYPRIASQ